MPLLEVRELTKDFGGLRAVDNCTFAVEPGSVTSLIGPNGAGKTTVFNIVSATVRPTSGRVILDGADLSGLAPHTITRRGVGRTFQIPRELGDLTVCENMVVSAPTRGFRALVGRGVLAQERRRALELLDFVGIAHLADELAKNLSYGQKKLLEFASVLMPAPRLILLDEPSGGVNPALLDSIVGRIEELSRDGVTFLLVEHNMDLVMRLSDAVVVMAHGSVLTQGSPDEVRIDTAVIDAYLGAV